MRVRVFWEGKTKDPRLRELIADYAGRISKLTDFAIEELSEARKSNSKITQHLNMAEQRMLDRMGKSTRVFLDPEGSEWTSNEFAMWLGEQGIRGAREIAFAVGGPDGFSSEFRKQAHRVLSLSRMTLTHEWARAMLLEQIYRGFTILRGFPYAR
jgi:23S rRNA (pseudouridine1915-N3)-methyltransferase